MRLRKRICWLLLLAHGCALIPNHDLATNRESCGCDQGVSSALNSGIVSLGDFPNERWWEDFEDPVLTKIIDEALCLSPTLAKAEASLKESYEKAMEKRASLFPTVDLDIYDVWTHLSKYGILRAFAPSVYPMMLNDTIFGLSYSYEFDFWGKNRSLFQAALGEAAAMAAEKKQAELVLTTSIAYTYAEFQMFLQKRDLLIKMEINSREIENIQMKRQKNGLDNAFNPIDASLNILDLKAQIVGLESQMEVNLHKIKALAGVGQDCDLEIVAHPFKSSVFLIPECLSLNLLGRRPDLMAQKMRVEAAAKEIHVAKTQFYPNINLRAFTGFASVFWDKLFTGDSYTGVLEPALSLPLFKGGQLRANLGEKVAKYNEAVNAYDELILQAGQEIADILTSIERYTKESEVRENGLNLHKRRGFLKANLFDNALADRMAVLNSQNQILEAKISLLEVEFGKIQAGINLIKSLGGGYHE